MTQASPARPTLLRHLNDRTVLSVLLDGGPATRTEIAARTGLSKPTIAEVVGRLMASGRLREAGEESGRRGPNGRLYGIALDRAAGLAVTVEPRGLRAELVDAQGTVLASATDPDGARRPDAATTVAGLARRLTRGGSIELPAVVVSVPGSYDPERDQVRYADRVPAWTEPGLVARIAHELAGTATVTIDNDVNLALVAESTALPADGTRVRCLLWLADGVGLATEIDGTLYRGTSGGAGEIGYVPVPAGAVRDTTTRRRRPTDFHDLVGAKAVVTLARTHGLGAGDATAVVARAAARPTDPSASAFLDELAGRVAVGLAIVAAVLDPGLVVLGGTTGIAGGRALAVRTQRALRATTRLSCAVLPSAVADDAVLAGARVQAARQVREHLLDLTPPDHE